MFDIKSGDGAVPGQARGGKTRYPFDKLQPGAYFEAPLYDRVKVQSACQYHGRKLNIKFAVRRVGALVRIYRVVEGATDEK